MQVMLRSTDSPPLGLPGACTRYIMSSLSNDGWSAHILSAINKLIHHVDIISTNRYPEGYRTENL